MNDIHEHSQVIDKLGGTTVVAKLCDVEPQAVSQWRKHGIPAARLMFLRLLRPDVFKGEDITGKPSEPDSLTKPSDDCGRRVIADRRHEKAA